MISVVPVFMPQTDPDSQSCPVQAASTDDASGLCVSNHAQRLAVSISYARLLRSIDGAIRAVNQTSLNCNVLLRRRLVIAASLLASVFLELLNVGRMCNGVDRKVHCERAESQSETGEDVTCKETVREDGVLAPCLALGPWVAVELRHDCECMSR